MSPAIMGAAVSACTLGMAAVSLPVALFSDRIDRRRGIVVSLAELSVPALLLATAPTVWIFAALRVARGLCMFTAFSLTQAYLGERMTGAAATRAFAAYASGNVASNLIGRFVASGVAGEWGIDASFHGFAGLNLLGAALVAATIHRLPKMKQRGHHARSPVEALRVHLANRRLRAGFAFGFCIPFVFIGVFTCVNFELGGGRFGLSMMALRRVYFALLPSILTAAQAGAVALRIGVRRSALPALGLTTAGVGLMALDRLGAVLAGMPLVGVGVPPAGCTLPAISRATSLALSC